MVRLVYDSRNKSTCNLEPLQHSDPNGIIVQPSQLLIIDHDCYTLRKALIAILATVQFFKIPLWVVRLVYDSRNKSTCNLEPLQHSDPNGIIVQPSQLLIIDHDCYTLRKALIAILATVQFFKIPLWVVRLVYDSRNKSTCNLEPLQHSDPNGIIVQPSQLLIIDHDCYTLRKALIAILATVQFFKIPLWVVRLVYDSRNKSTCNLEPLQHSDPNGIIVQPSQLLIIDHDCYTLRKALIAILATVQFFKIPLWVVRLVYDSRNKSTCNLEPLQHSDPNGIIVQPSQLLIIDHDCYTLRKALIAILATVQFFKIPLWVVRLVYDSRNKSTCNLEPLQHSDPNGIIVQPSQLLIIDHDCYTLRKALIAILATVQFFKIPLWVVRLVYDSRNKSTCNLEPLQHSDPNGIIVQPSQLLIIDHDCYTLRKALIAILATVQFFKIPLWVVRLVYDSRNKSTCNLEPLQHSDPNGIIVQPSQLLIIDHDCYTLRKALIAILATVQFFKIPLWVVRLVYDSRNKSTCNLEPLQHSDPNGIIVQPSQLLIIDHDCYTLRKALIAILATVQFFKIPLWVVRLVYDSRNKSTCNLEPLQHSDPNGIIVQPSQLLIIDHDCYTLRKALIAILAAVQFFKIPLWVVRLVYDSRNKSTCNLEPLQHSDPNGIIVQPSQLLIIDHDCYTLRKALIAILATVQFFKIPLWVVRLVYDSRNKSTCNLEPLQHSDPNGIIAQPS